MSHRPPLALALLAAGLAAWGCAPSADDPGKAIQAGPDPEAARVERRGADTTPAAALGRGSSDLRSTGVEGIDRDAPVAPAAPDPDAPTGGGTGAGTIGLGRPGVIGRGAPPTADPTAIPAPDPIATPTAEGLAPHATRARSPESTPPGEAAEARRAARDAPSHDPEAHAIAARAIAARATAAHATATRAVTEEDLPADDAAEEATADDAPAPGAARAAAAPARDAVEALIPVGGSLGLSPTIPLFAFHADPTRGISAHPAECRHDRILDTIVRVIDRADQGCVAQRNVLTQVGVELAYVICTLPDERPGCRQTYIGTVWVERTPGTHHDYELEAFGRVARQCGSRVEAIVGPPDRRVTRPSPALGKLFEFCGQRISATASSSSDSGEGRWAR